MTISEMLLPEFDYEMAVTRTTLARIPDEKLDWRPHAKSFTLRELGSHLANLGRWGVLTLTRSEVDLADPAMAHMQPLPSAAAMLAAFDEHTVAARAALAAVSDAAMADPWTLRAGDVVYFTQPRLAILRSFFLNHLIHHRAQLGLYLRMLDVPMPFTYGPTADEGMG